MKILYVDDDATMRDLIGRILRKLGFDVEAVASAAAALGRLHADFKRFDAVVTDLAMPEVTGIQLAHAVKEIAPDLPIIAFTGSVLPYLESSEQTRLFAAVVSKGKDVPALRDAILQSVGSRSP